MKLTPYPLRFPQGERSFFLQPGEHLENGIQDIYILSAEEGLVLRALEAFMDTEAVEVGGDSEGGKVARRRGWGHVRVFLFHPSLLFIYSPVFFFLLGG